MKTCLIVDDANVIRKVAEAILTDLHFLVIEAEDTARALEVCETECPDVVILDWHIPYSDPIELITTIRSNFGADRPTIIYCSTENSDDVIRPALDAGADGFLLKPFDRHSFIAVLAEHKLAA